MPILGADAPFDDLITAPPETAPGKGRQPSERRSKQWSGLPPDGGRTPLDLAQRIGRTEARQIGMTIGVVAEEVSCRDDGVDEARMAADLLANQEKRRPGAMPCEDSEKALSIGPWTVIERQGDNR